MSASDGVFEALEEFADAVRSTTRATAPGDPESQLIAPTQRLLETVGRSLARRLTIVTETPVHGLGQPDFCVEDRGVWVGYVELKAPGKGAGPEQYRGHDRRQWDRFRQLPNLIYTDGSEFALYRTGTRVGPLMRFSGRVDQTGRCAITRQDTEQFRQLYAIFLAWEPAALPDRPTARDIADLLAPLCRLLREEVEEAVGMADSALSQVAAEWRELLFPEADNHRFADAGLPADHLTCHSSSATTLIDLLDKGVLLEDVQCLAGHADPRTTRLYGHRKKQLTRNLVERSSI